MTKPCEKYHANKPVAGDWVTYTYNGQVSRRQITRVDGGLCFTRYDDGEVLPFIWCFHDGLNTLHDWPTKGGRV